MIGSQPSQPQDADASATPASATVSAPVPPKKNIVILGGGISALTAAIELTNVPNWQEKYTVSIYQMGWRLGGKGASGRNQADHDRVEEHGLHIWFGFYENAFALMRACYCELKRPPSVPITDVENAFTPQNLFTFMECIDNQWQHWPIPFATNPAKPGTGDSILPSMWDYLVEIVNWLCEMFKKSPTAQSLEATSTQPVRPAMWSQFSQSLDADVRHLAESGESHLLEAASVMVSRATRDVTQHRAIDHSMINWMLKQFKAWLDRVLKPIVDHDTELLHFYWLMDLGLSFAIGFLRDGVLLNGLDAIDNFEFTDWLTSNGCSQSTAYCTLTQSLYDASFAYDGEKKEDRSMAASVAVRVIMRVLLTYKGSVIWKMNSGMGDTIFAPIYEVLVKRGVAINFFHKVKEIHLTPDKSAIASVVLTKQADLADGIDTYNPLYPVNGLPCWPNQPFWEQLKQGQYLKDNNINLESRWADWAGVGDLTLNFGTDFSLVILGIPIAAYPDIAPEILHNHPPFQSAYNAIRTVQTTAIQLWFGPDQQQMQWVDQSNIISSYTEPYSSISDFSQLIPTETWPAGTVGTIAYSCGVAADTFTEMPPPSDHGFPAAETTRAHDSGLQFLEQDPKSIWPGVAQASGELDWSSLVAPADAQDKARYEAQYWHMNIDPTERYDTSPAHSSPSRIPTNGTNIMNLYVTGTWTYTGLNVSCIEAAVISGMLASQAICGFPTDIPGAKDIIV